MSVEDMILNGICEGCDQDPAQCWNKDFCVYEEQEKQNNDGE